jgi:hypothetical protein
MAVWPAQLDREQGYKQMKDELGWRDFMWSEATAPSAATGTGVLRLRLLLVARSGRGAFAPGDHAACASQTGGGAGAKKIQPSRPRTRRCWPRLVRAVRAWLSPLRWLMRCWRACSSKPPPTELAVLFEFLMAGCGINPYLRL